MLNANERENILRMLKNPALEMMPSDLKAMLADELKLPAEKMNTALVEELLSVLHDCLIPEKAKKQTWQWIRAQIEQAQLKRQRKARALRRAAVAVAGVVLLCGLTLGAAKAFRWKFLYTLIEPFAKTFGVQLNDDVQPTPQVSMANANNDGAALSSRMVYTSPDDLPSVFSGYPIKPSWVPEGYRFVQGTVFYISFMDSVTLLYMDGEEPLRVLIQIYDMENSELSYDHEMVSGTTKQHMLNDLNITLYLNSDGSISSASWIDNTAKYVIAGNIAQDDMLLIIQELYGG